MTAIAVNQPLRLEMSEQERFFRYFQTEVAGTRPALQVQRPAQASFADPCVLGLSAAGTNANHTRSRHIWW